MCNLRRRNDLHLRKISLRKVWNATSQVALNLRVYLRVWLWVSLPPPLRSWASQSANCVGISWLLPLHLSLFTCKINCFTWSFPKYRVWAESYLKPCPVWTSWTRLGSSPQGGADGWRQKVKLGGLLAERGERADCLLAGSLYLI